jgi:cytoskeletal protein CcmA (bactofilin family)
MNKLHSPWIRLSLILALTFVAVFGVVRTVWAGEIIDGETIPKGTVIEDDAVISGEDVVVDGDVIGDLLAFGNTVTINGKVAGSLVAAGQEVQINGEVDGTVYVAAARLELGPSAITERNVYYAGFRIVTDEGSSVGRDLNTVAIGAQFAGQVGRNLNAMIGIVELVDKVRETITNQTSGIEAPSPVIGTLGVEGGGLLTMVNSTGRRGPGIAAPAYGSSRDIALMPSQANGGVDWDKIGDWFSGRLAQLIVLFIVGGLALWLIPSQFDGWAQSVRHKPLPSAGLGLLTYILGYAGAIMTAVLLFFGGLAMGIAVAWELALSLWALGFSSLILAFVVFVIFVSYVSKAIVAYLGGLLILDRVAPGIRGRKVLALLLGLLLYVIIVTIPTLGPIIGFLVTILGLGAVWVAWLDGRRRKREQETYEKIRAELDAEEPKDIVPGEAIDVGALSAADARFADAVELGRQRAESDIQARINDLGEKNGPWSYSEALGEVASDPFDRALLSVMGILAASKEQNVYYIADADSEGNPLRGDTDYTITGKDLPARWWSITAYDPLFLIANEKNRYSINKSTLELDKDGRWQAFLTAEPREDKQWIHSGGGETELSLALRLYNPSPEVLADMGAIDLPEILPAPAEAPEEAAEVADVVEVEPESDTSVPATDEEGDDAGDVADDSAEPDASAEGDEADE